METTLALTARLAPASAEIAAKVIDGEAIIINLTNGYYYSMDGAGALIWKAIQRCHSLSEIGETLSRRYDVSADVAVPHLRALIQQMLQEELVKVVDVPVPDVTGEAQAESSRQPYQPPTLEKYGDMAHFFALDPPLPDLEEDVRDEGRE